MIKVENIKREQVYCFLLLVFLVALPIRVAYSSVAAIVLGAFFVLDRPENIKTKLKKVSRLRLYQLFFLYFVLQIIGLLYTENTVKGIKEVRQLIPIIILPLTILSESISQEKLIKLLIFFKNYIMLLLMGLMMIQLAFFENGFLQFESNAFALLKINSFYYSAFIFVSFIITLFELKKKRFNSIRNYTEALILMSFLLLLGTRIALSIIVLSLILFFYSEIKTLNLLKKTTILLVILSGLLVSAYAVPDIYKKLNITIKNTDFDHEIVVTKNKYSITRNSLEYRYLINYSGLQIVKQNPLGVGTGDHQEVLLEWYKKLEFRAGIQRRFNAHNQYLSEALKLGYIGLIVFVLLLGYILKISLKEKKHLFYTIIYIVIVCLVESYFDRHHGVMFVAFFVPLLFYLENEKAVISK